MVDQKVLIDAQLNVAPAYTPEKKRSSILIERCKSLLTAWAAPSLPDGRGGSAQMRHQGAECAAWPQSPEAQQSWQS